MRTLSIVKILFVGLITLTLVVLQQQFESAASERNDKTISRHDFSTCNINLPDVSSEDEDDIAGGELLDLGGINPFEYPSPPLPSTACRPHVIALTQHNSLIILIGCFKI